MGTLLLGWGTFCKDSEPGTGLWGDVELVAANSWDAASCILVRCLVQMLSSPVRTC